MDDYSVMFGKNTRLIVLLIALGLLLTGFTVGARKNITLDFDDKKEEYTSFANTVGSFLEKEGIQVKEGSYLSHSLEDKLENNMHIIIKEAKSYNLKIGDSLEEGLLSPYNKVENILKDLGHKPGELDYSKPALSENIEEGETIELFKVKEVIEEKEIEIPFEKILRDNKNMEEGESKLVQEGKAGLKKQKIKKRIVNDQVEETTIVEETVIEEPVDELKEKGTKKMLTTSRGKSNFKRSLVMNATAYDDSPQSQGKWVGRTATGVKPRRGVVAVDPKVIPLGTKLYVEGYGECVAADTGGAIKGNRIDLFFPTRQEVRNFGRRKVKVYILD